MNEKRIDSVRDIIREHEMRYRRSANRWKFGYRVCLAGSAICSAQAAIAGKLQWYGPAGPDWAAGLAAAAAILTTVIAAFDFETNWRANRRARHEAASLVLETEKSTADADQLLGEMQKIVRMRMENLNSED